MVRSALTSRSRAAPYSIGCREIGAPSSVIARRREQAAKSEGPPRELRENAGIHCAATTARHIDVRRQMLEDEAGESRPFAVHPRAQLGHLNARELLATRAQQSGAAFLGMDKTLLGDR